MPAGWQRRQIEILLDDLATVREGAPPTVGHLRAPADRFPLLGRETKFERPRRRRWHGTKRDLHRPAERNRQRIGNTPRGFLGEAPERLAGLHLRARR